jgi:2,3-bisphosphoglycerate-dependent phosphoglycerate mutase
MDLLVIRHGQSEADIVKVYEGRADFPLTALGCKQAQRMAEWVSGYSTLDKIYASPLKRAAKTAQILSNAAGTSVEFDDLLMEWQNGLIAGLTPAEAAQKYPAPAQKFPHTAVYGQESAIEFRARAETALSKIIYENPMDAKIAVVSHGGMINRLFQCFLGLPITADTVLYSGDTGIHHWRIPADNRTARHIVFTNRLLHIENI